MMTLKYLLVKKNKTEFKYKVQTQKHLKLKKLKNFVVPEDCGKVVLMTRSPKT
jgi:hypothetical protein